MIYPSPGELKDRIEAMTPRRVRGEVNVFEDTSSYMAIIPGGGGGRGGGGRGKRAFLMSSKV